MLLASSRPGEATQPQASSARPARKAASIARFTKAGSALKRGTVWNRRVAASDGPKRLAARNRPRAKSRSPAGAEPPENTAWRTKRCSAGKRKSGPIRSKAKANVPGSAPCQRSLSRRSRPRGKAAAPHGPTSCKGADSMVRMDCATACEAAIEQNRALVRSRLRIIMPVIIHFAAKQWPNASRRRDCENHATSTHLVPMFAYRSYLSESTPCPVNPILPNPP